MKQIKNFNVGIISLSDKPWERGKILSTSNFSKVI